MNRTKIEWTDYTWNPVTGCLKNCWYCYVKRMPNYNTTPALHSVRLIQPALVKKPSKIFVCSTGDLFGSWVPNVWIRKVLDSIHFHKHHTYQLLTKNPYRMLRFDGGADYPIKYPKNVWLGVTMTKDDFPTLGWTLFETTDNIKFMSYEPLFSKVNVPRDINWIIIGAMTGSGSEEHQPKLEWIEDILRQADVLKIPVFMKNNLNKVWRGKLRREFPNEKETCNRI